MREPLKAFLSLFTLAASSCPDLAADNPYISYTCSFSPGLGQQCEVTCLSGYVFTNENLGSKQTLTCPNGASKWSPTINLSCKPVGDMNQVKATELQYLTQTNDHRCLHWNRQHYKTFDGMIYSFDSNSCKYLLAMRDF